MDTEFYDLFRLNDHSLLIITWAFMIIGSVGLMLDNWVGFMWLGFGVIFAMLDYLRKDNILRGMRRRLNAEIRTYNEQIRRERENNRDIGQTVPKRRQAKR